MTPGEIIEVLTDHIGTGDVGPLAMARLLHFLPYIPTDCRGGPGRVWRAVRISDSMLAAYRRGEDLVLEARPLSCWTRGRGVAWSFARNLAETHLGRGGILILEREISANQCAIDVPKVFRHFDAWYPDQPGWSFFSREQEVIVREDGKPFVVTPVMVVHALSCTDPELGHPHPGELVDVESGAEEILAVLERLGEDRYRVELASGISDIDRDRHGWLADPDPTPVP
ncbi:hypothetical protein LAZ40_03265 [Cereibacter sphaeroides]|uniref:hypothetical protein n=1 Tax=Cereibacter sphaeroides TaxID=1063 RepID=UPI001F1CED01|nr:hypothetical protein [Cereibacter sphaeroides]MCE6958075.1 hypothetical protein [Cereibacter sphaeroides]MCE6971314.1 hypothetical protein [Cereibacter sphaeroides]